MGVNALQAVELSLSHFTKDHTQNVCEDSHSSRCKSFNNVYIITIFRIFILFVITSDYATNISDCVLNIINGYICIH